MTDDRVDPQLVRRLHLVATNLVLRTAPFTAAAVDLACDLLAAGMDTPSTVEVATLRRDTADRESEQVVRSMLDEQGVPQPIAGTEHERYAAIQHAFAFWGLPLADFEGPFYQRLPSWDAQGPLDRSLVVMLDERDHESDPVRRAEIEEQMREEIRRTESL